jgi:pimeloyl-ACP methyl ester carboxylesterase
MLHRNKSIVMNASFASGQARWSSPSWLLLGTEPLRAAVEFAGLHCMNRADLPKGDGHTVIMFPGLASDRLALKPLSRFCGSLGYTVIDWGRGFNTGPEGDVDQWLDRLTQDVITLAGRQSGGVTLLGWSLGGIYAREVAKRWLHGVRQVITLGTPFAGSPDSTNVGFVYRLLNGQAPPNEAALQARLMTAPPVPTTSIYSRADGIVAWQSCLQRADHERCENIEVDGSHCGLGWNAKALAIIADRLSQPVGAWQAHGNRAPAA